MKDFSSLYTSSYFGSLSDKEKRRKMYRQEFTRLSKYIPSSGRVLDIGCGTGEFLELFGKTWKKYGTEVSKYAIVEAKKRDINFNVPIKNNFFDVVIFRGTIQHLDKPIAEIKERIKQLKPGGLMIFLATPNAGGVYYRIFQDLPMLDKSRNFFIPSERVLSNILKNFGLKVKKVHYPYLVTPYASPFFDHIYFTFRLLGLGNKKHAFWGNLMEIYAKK